MPQSPKKGIRAKFVPVGKVFGYYDPAEDRIGIDPVVFPEANDPERETLKRYMEIPRAERTLGEEFSHKDQKDSGAIARYEIKLGPKKAREYIEGAAASINDYIFGSTGIYSNWKAKFRSLSRNIGLRRAYSGF